MSDTPEPPKKGLEEPETEYRDDERPLTDAEIDAWLERNHEALNASCDEAEAKIERGEYYTWEEVMAELKEQARLRRARKA